MSIAADFLSRLEADGIEKIVLSIREDITVRTFEVNIESKGIAPEQPVFNTDDDLTEIPEQGFWERKADVRNTISSQPMVITIASYYHIDLPKKPSILDMAHVNKPSGLFIEQISDPFLLNFK